MDAFSKYQAIQDFKRSGAAVFAGINYANVIAVRLYDTSVKGFVHKLAYALLFDTIAGVSPSGTQRVLTLYSCRGKGRRDYDFIADRVSEVLGSDACHVELVDRPSFLQWSRTLKRFPSSWRCTAALRGGFFARLGAALLIAKYRSFAEDSLSRLLQGSSRLVTFCDAHPLENLAVQIGRASGTFTLTNQHGQYRGLTESNMSPDAEAYANFVSHQMLCWGAATRDEFVRLGFDSDQFAITGWVREWQLPDHGPDRERKGVFGVMLNGENARASNPRLIDTAKRIAEGLGLRYVVRLHPLNDPRDYANLVDGNCEFIGVRDLRAYLDETDFSIAHMTGATIEMLHAGIPVYLLDDGSLASIFSVPGLSFSDVSGILSAIQLDASQPEECRQRLGRLANWFNDDRMQAQRLKQFCLGGDA